MILVKVFLSQRNGLGEDFYVLVFLYYINDFHLHCSLPNKAPHILIFN